MINRKRTTQCSVMQQRNVCQRTVGIVASGYVVPGSDVGTNVRRGEATVPWPPPQTLKIKKCINSVI